MNSDIKIGISPIGWSNDDLIELGKDNSLERFLKDAKEIGFAGVELGNKFPKDKKALKAVLKEYDLELAGGWFSGNLLQNSLEKEKEILLKEIERRVFNNCSNIVYAECSNTIQNKNIPLSQKPVLSEDAMKKYAEKYSLLCEFAKENGVILAYHHHMGTIIQNANEVDMFLKYSSKEVALTFDSGHYYFAGANPLEQLQKHYQQIKHIHFKDLREAQKQKALQEDSYFLQAVIDGVFTTPADGVLDFKPLIKHLKANQYKGYIIIEAEQDPKKANPFVYSQKAFKYINSLLKD